MNLHKCSVCNKEFKNDQIVHSDMIRQGIYNLIKKDIPSWNESSVICKDDLHFYQNKFI